MPLTENDKLLLERCLRRQPFSWHSFVDRFISLALQVIEHTASNRGLELNDQQIEQFCTELFAELRRDQFLLLRQFDGNSSLTNYLTIVFRRVAGTRMVALEQDMKTNGAATRGVGANSDSDSRWN